MSKNSRILTRRSKESVKTATVRAVADSTQEQIDTQRKSTRSRKRKAPENDESDDSNDVSGSQTRKTRRASKQALPNRKSLPCKKVPVMVSKMGRRIPLTVERAKTPCTATGTELVTGTEPPSPLRLPAISTSLENAGNGEDNNILMREWLERKADKDDLPGLQWYDKPRGLIKISWKHGSKSDWTTDDSQVFTSWARCTGLQLIVYCCEI